MEIFTVLINVTCALSLFYYIFLISKNNFVLPTTLNKDYFYSLSVLKKVVLCCAVFTMFAVLFSGMNGFLYFFPSWGYVDYEEGEFYTYKGLFALLFAMFAGCTIMEIVHLSTKTALKNEINEIEAKELKRILFASQKQLRELKEEYKKHADKARLSTLDMKRYQEYKINHAYQQLERIVDDLLLSKKG